MFLSGCSHNARIPREIRYDGHPLIGSWRLNNNGCMESYEFFPDGTRTITSDQKIVKAVYSISETKTEQGFYKLTTEVTEDNGKPDCSGSANDTTGDIFEMYFTFTPAEELAIFCFEENIDDRCLGPFQKN